MKKQQQNQQKQKIELIETLWNVNDNCSFPDWKAAAYELIETLWNVNAERLRYTKCNPGINRNIVECK